MIGIRIPAAPQSLRNHYVFEFNMKEDPFRLEAFGIVPPLGDRDIVLGSTPLDRFRIGCRPKSFELESPKCSGKSLLN